MSQLLLETGSVESCGDLSFREIRQGPKDELYPLRFSPSVPCRQNRLRGPDSLRSGRENASAVPGRTQGDYNHVAGVGPIGSEEGEWRRIGLR
jgi:hypothetical protein